MEEPPRKLSKKEKKEKKAQHAQQQQQSQHTTPTMKPSIRAFVDEAKKKYPHLTEEEITQLIIRGVAEIKASGST